MPYNDAHVGYGKKATSREAAYFVRPKAASLRTQIIQFLKMSPNTARSTEEIAVLMGLEYREVQPRISELLRMELLEDSGFREVGRYGRNVCKWSLPQ